MKIDRDDIVIIILSMWGGNVGAAVTREVYETPWPGLIGGVLFGAAIGIYATKWLRNRPQITENRKWI